MVFPEERKPTESEPYVGETVIWCRCECLVIITSRGQASSGATMSLGELCKKGDLEGVKAALQKGLDVNAKDEYGVPGLVRAVCYNHDSAEVNYRRATIVALLLKTPNIDVNLKSNLGKCALHVAVRDRNNEALKLLLNVPNINVNVVDINGENIVHLAVFKNNIALWLRQWQ